MNRTQVVLVSRGLDTVRAEQLVAAGSTLRKLKACTKAGLTALGFKQAV